jgi:hypothetical protein
VLLRQGLAVAELAQPVQRDRPRPQVPSAPTAERRGVLRGRFVAEHQEQATFKPDVTGTVRPPILAQVIAVFGPGIPDLRDDAEELAARDALRLARVAERPVASMVEVATGVRAVGMSIAVIAGSGVPSMSRRCSQERRTGGSG